MPPPQKYADNKERQAAYRARHAQSQPPRKRELANRARYLHAELRGAIEDGQSVLPDKLLGANAKETLTNITRFIRWNTERGRADLMLQMFLNLNPDEPFAVEPVRYPE